MSEEAVLPAEEETPEGHGDEQLVPGWLALLVLILLLGIFALGGWLLNDLLRGDRAPSLKEANIREWKDRVERDPSDPAAHLGLGFAYQQDKEYEDALREYDAVLKARPKDPAALYNKGVVLMELKKYKAAETTLWDVLETEPTHALAAKKLGEYYASKGQYKSLKVAVRPAVDARPNLADLQYLMGKAHEKLGEKDQAVARYELALKYVPDMTEARQGLQRLGVEE